MMEIKINSKRKKALIWWRNMNKDTQLAVVLNPWINTSKIKDIRLVSRSSIIIEKMFIKWLERDAMLKKKN